MSNIGRDMGVEIEIEGRGGRGTEFLALEEESRADRSIL
jgi:hypothetical protein